MASSSAMSLNGRIDKTDIPTLLRSVEKDKNSGELSFNRNGERIDLYFLFGQLYHAKSKQVSGLDAVMELLDWKNGNYAFTEGVIPAQATINEDIETILALKNPQATATPEPRGSALAPDRPRSAAAQNQPPHAHADSDHSDLIPFDLSVLSGQLPETPVRAQATQSAANDYDTLPEMTDEAIVSSGRVAPSPPTGGLYRTKVFCLPTGEQMATSLVATGPQLEEELMHLADVHFTGYVLGGPEISGYPTVGICLLHGRFIHAFYHTPSPNGVTVVEGERAYRAALDNRGSNAVRFYWFYELTNDTMRSAVALLNPPTRYVHLEVRIIRFKELLRLLNEESFSGCLQINVPVEAGRQGGSATIERAYVPIYQGGILGLWSEKDPRLNNNAQLLQNFLNEPQAYLDLHAAHQAAEPGIPLESLIVGAGHPVAHVENREPQIEPHTPSGNNRNPAAFGSGGRGDYSEPSIPALALPSLPNDGPNETVDDDERQLRLITTIGRMESTWTQQMQKKSTKVDSQMTLLALAGFGNEALSLIESVSGRRGVQDMVQRSLKHELAPYRTVFQMLDIAQGRVNIARLLREYELFSRDGGDSSATEFSREASRGLRTLLRSCFQYYVALIRYENTRYESQDIYEVFLQDVVRKM